MTESGIRFEYQWETAERARPPEHAATWARLRLFVDSDCLTVVEERSSQDLRNWIDVSLYPLAEWLAFSWWFVTSPSKQSLGGLLPVEYSLAPEAMASRVRLNRERFNFTSAADGFPWPDLTLMPQSGHYLVSQHDADPAHQRLRFVRNGLYVLDPERTIFTMSAFIDAVVRRLDDKGIEGTRLQTEWQVIQETDAEEEEFCKAAAVLGADPYQVTSETESALLAASRAVSDPVLLLDLLNATDEAHLHQALGWIESSLRAAEEVGDAVSNEIVRDICDYVRGRPQRPFSATLTAGTPWVTGYSRARMVRKSLDIQPAAPIDMSHIVGSQRIQNSAPGILEALARGAQSPLVVLPAYRTPQSERFLQARALSRLAFDGTGQHFVITHSYSLRDRTERAFAAELLAPADGIREFLEDDFSETARNRAADHFDAPRQVIDHQVENQLNYS